MTDLKVELTQRVNAPINKVFDAWLNAEMLSKFMTPIRDMPKPRVECEGQQGGRFTVYMMINGQEVPHSGEYLEVERPHKLVFTWESPCSTDGSTVTLNLKSIDENSTDVELIHVKFTDEETRSNHEGGWSTILAVLNETCSAPANASV